MDEYISKQKVLDYLNDFLHSIGEYNLLSDMGQRRALTTAIQDISAMKGADVQPVKHGRWENERYYSVLGRFYATCSECGCESADVNSITNNHKYCEHCGTKMDLKDSEPEDCLVNVGNDDERVNESIH